MNDQIDNAVVARIDGKPVTRSELNAAFDLVADPADWKNPVNAVVKLTPREVKLVAVAVPYFARFEAHFTILKGVHTRTPTYRVTTKGYYATGWA